MKRSRARELEAAEGAAPEAGEPARASEALLVAKLPEVKGTRILALSAGRAQLALAAALGDPARQVVCPFFELHQAERARKAAGLLPKRPAEAPAPSPAPAAATAPAPPPAAEATTIAAAAAIAPATEPEPAIPSNLSIECVADVPAGPFDTALVPLRAGADSELAWELLQTAYQSLVEGGRLWASVDEPRDRWVAGRMDALFEGRVGRHAGDAGRERKDSIEAVAYVGTKRGPLKKVKSFECEFAFRDRGRLIHAVSRPGVFSHRHLDLGARALIESLTDDAVVGPRGGKPPREWIQPGARVLDLGCGAGCVGFAAAFRAERVTVHAVDSMPRALDCARRGAEMNGLGARHTTQLSCDGSVEGSNSFDLVLANPPYYSHHAIAEVFVRGALRAVKPGGRVHFVTRQPEWFTERLARELKDVRVRVIRTYSIVDARRK